MPDWLREMLSKPTVTVPEVARALGIGRNQGYEAVGRGDIPAERFGSRIVIATAWLRRKLQIDEIDGPRIEGTSAAKSTAQESHP